MIKELILSILMLYIISVVAISVINLDVNETEFCQQNGFEEYGADGDQRFCFNKLFEGKKLFFEKNPIYCEWKPWLEMFYYQPPTETCYLLKEASNE